MKILEDPSVEHPSYAPPILKAGKLMIGQTANIFSILAHAWAWCRKTKRAGFGCINCSSR